MDTRPKNTGRSLLKSRGILGHFAKRWEEKKKYCNSARRFSKESISRQWNLETSSVHFANLTIITGLRRFRESRAYESRGKSYEEKECNPCIVPQCTEIRMLDNSGNPASPHRLLPASVTIERTDALRYRMYCLKMDPGTGRPVSTSAFNAI